MKFSINKSCIQAIVIHWHFERNIYIFISNKHSCYLNSISTFCHFFVEECWKFALHSNANVQFQPACKQRCQLAVNSLQECTLHSNRQINYQLGHSSASYHTEEPTVQTLNIKYPNSDFLYWRYKTEFCSLEFLFHIGKKNASFNMQTFL